MKVICIHNGSIEIRMDPEDLIEQAFVDEMKAKSAKGLRLMVEAQPEGQGLPLSAAPGITLRFSD